MSATPCYRLMAPHRPEEYRQETWGVLHAEQVRSLQRGSPVLRADHDFRQMCERSPSKVPIYFMTGLYGWACTPEKTQSTAGKGRTRSASSMEERGKDQLLRKRRGGWTCRSISSSVILLPPCLHMRSSSSLALLMRRLLASSLGVVT